MINIPEGTQFIEAGCGNKGFRKYEKGQWWFFEGFWRVVDWKMGDLTSLADHPDYIAPVTPWSGEGLPPVGTVCERRFHDEGSSWQRVTITAHGHKKIMCLEETGDEWAHFALEVSFRPARTPEQIAEEERTAGLNEMIRCMKDHPRGTHGASHMQELMIHEDVARDLWAAGYRKQEAS